MTVRSIFLMVMIMTSSVVLHAQEAIARRLFDNYDRFKHPAITTRHFTQAELLGWLKPFHERGTIQQEPVGKSSEGRTIALFTYGTGAVKVLLWSQMHGDEPTATMALVDMIRLFDATPDDEVVRTIREKLTLLMIPMLNPDGAERFQRRSVHEIDINRDALQLVTSEARILKETQEKHKPEFGFNLHDQDPRYTVGSSTRVAAMALLAPTVDEAGTITPARKRALSLAAAFAETMQLFIPGHLAKYDDTFEPRAFGDNIQKWGTSTLLVESGGWPNDPEKMFLRKLNFVGLLTSLYGIATSSYDRAQLSAYESLPFNGENLYDIIVRGATMVANDSLQHATVDIGFNIEEQFAPGTRTVERIVRVTDIGDLSTFGAFEEVDGAGLRFSGEQIRIDRTLLQSDLSRLLRSR
jgi:hypothetical protein